MNTEYTIEKKEKAKKIVKTVLKVIGFTILGACAIVLFGFIIMWLWNWLMPSIFSLREITYWEGLGILVLSKIIFGGFGGGVFKRPSSGGFGGNRAAPVTRGR